jgi:phage/plasmid-associated DNA primase
LDGEDSIAGWIGECCERQGMVKLTAAHGNYRDWCKSCGISALGRNTFGDQLASHGIRRAAEKRGGTAVFHGLQLLTQVGSPAGDF